MRHAGRIVADVLALMEEELRPGVTTAQLDAIAEDYIRKAGGRPSFKGYKGFPACICVSIDDEVVHGIPGGRVIEEGQVVSVDAGAIWQGYHGDAARTFYVGTAPADVARLIQTTRTALMDNGGLSSLRMSSTSSRDVILVSSGTERLADGGWPSMATR